MEKVDDKYSHPLKWWLLHTAIIAQLIVVLYLIIVYFLNPLDIKTFIHYIAGKFFYLSYMISLIPFAYFWHHELELNKNSCIVDFLPKVQKYKKISKIFFVLWTVIFFGAAVIDS